MISLKPQNDLNGNFINSAKNINSTDSLDVNKTISVKTYSFIFTAILWRRVWITSIIYCEHNNIKMDKSIILKCLKYNVFSGAGIINIIKFYIDKALSDGFMMPQFYKENIYATKASELFRSAYEVINKKNIELETEFIKKYATSIFDSEKDQNKEKYTKRKNEKKYRNKKNRKTVNIEKKNIELISETENILSIINGQDTEQNFFSMIKHSCKLCDLIDSWDINTDLIFDCCPFQTKAMNILINIIK